MLPQVQKHGPGDDAGLQAGDVILAVGSYAVDQDGDYVDPEYGKLSVINLILRRKKLRRRCAEIQNLPRREESKRSMSKSAKPPAGLITSSSPTSSARHRNITCWAAWCSRNSPASI